MFRFLAVTNRFLCKGKPLIRAVEEAIAGGVEAVLLREQGLDDRVLYVVARQFKRVLEGRGIPLLISQRVDIAMAVGAQGVHLDGSSLPVEVARPLLGPDATIGFSAHSVEEAIEAQGKSVDYVTLSPIFPTRSKPLARPLGVNCLREVAERSRVPVFALGGIGPLEARQAFEAGAYGVAVMSALWKGDPREVAEEITREMKEIVRP